MSKKHTRRQLTLDQCYDALEGLDPSSTEYAAVVDQITKLETKPNHKAGIDKNTLATLAVYAGLTILIVVVEIFGHSLTSRAMSAVPFKPRLL